MKSLPPHCALSSRLYSSQKPFTSTQGRCVCAGAHIQEVTGAPPLTSQWGSRRTHQDPRCALKGPYSIHTRIPSPSNRAARFFVTLFVSLKGALEAAE
ncbi:hypothetical protein QQF64_022379 [Cirrhinus molitorella]|uniref:Uncharacterized protein n=1 Tax=Cirrhinus molitorella TaxID=172907 RepID=A0ABR3LAE0_9TELE